CADDRYDCRLPNPMLRAHIDANGWKFGEERMPSAEADSDAQRDSSQTKNDGLPQDDVHDVALRGSQRLENPNFSRAFHDCRIHRLKNDDESNAYGDSDDNVDGDGKTGQGFGSNQA